MPGGRDNQTGIVGGRGMGRGWEGTGGEGIEGCRYVPVTPALALLWLLQYV